MPNLAWYKLWFICLYIWTYYMNWPVPSLLTEEHYPTAIISVIRENTNSLILVVLVIYNSYPYHHWVGGDIFLSDTKLRFRTPTLWLQTVLPIHHNTLSSLVMMDSYRQYKHSLQMFSKTIIWILYLTWWNINANVRDGAIQIILPSLLTHRLLHTK